MAVAVGARGVGVGALVGVGDGVAVGVFVAVGDGVAVCVGVGSGVAVGVFVAVGSGVAVCVGVGSGVAVGVFVAVGDGVAVRVGVGSGVAVGVFVAVGVAVGCASAVAVISATTVARVSGVAVGIGVEVGWASAVAVISATTVARVSGAGAGSPQASAMSDTQRARASGRLRLVEIVAPVHRKFGRAGETSPLASMLVRSVASVEGYSAIRQPPLLRRQPIYHEILVPPNAAVIRVAVDAVGYRHVARLGYGVHPYIHDA